MKGGASRVVIGLKRTTKQDGGRWELNVESHFGSWDEPLYYQRPERPDGSRGVGCVRCSASRARGISFNNLKDLFIDYGVPDQEGSPTITSKNKLIEALIKARHASGNNDGSEIVNAILSDYCIHADASESDSGPIVTSKGARMATVFTWRGV